MKKSGDSVQAHLEELRESVHELREQTEAVKEAALDVSRAAYGQIHDKTLAYSREADHRIRDHVYWSVGAALGAGVLLGVLMAGQPDGDRDGNS